MFETIDYLKDTPWVGLINMISDRTGYMLEATKCSLQHIQSGSGTTTVVVIRTNRSLSPKNLEAPLPEEFRITFDPLNTHEINITYDRIDCSETFNDVGLYVVTGLKIPCTTMDVLGYISRERGYVFDVNDFVNVEYSANGTHTLTANEESLRWYGSFQIDLHSGNARQLSTVTPNVDLGDVVLLPPYRAGSLNTAVYMNTLMFSEYRFELNAIRQSPNGLTQFELVRILNIVTGDPWVCSHTPSQYNINSKPSNEQPGFNVIYSGPPVRRYTRRLDAKAIVVVELSQTMCMGLIGPLVLHYN